MGLDQTTPKPDVFAQPPRFLPLSVWCHAYFGGFWNQIGWGLLCFGMLFVWIFARNADFASLIYFGGTLATAQGTVTDVKETIYRESRRGSVEFGNNRSRRRAKPIFALHYEFAHAGRTFNGVSYGVLPEMAVGDPANIEFPTGDPMHSRIVGMRTKPFGAWVVFVCVFALAGLAMVVSGVRFGRKAARLLRDGKTAEATLVNKEETGARVDKKPVYKLSFEFTAGDGKQYQTSTKTHYLERFSGESETLLYDPADPSYALPVDALPRRPAFDASGEFVPRSALSTFFVMLLPTLAVISNVVIAVIWMAE